MEPEHVAGPACKKPDRDYCATTARERNVRMRISNNIML